MKRDLPKLVKSHISKGFTPIKSGFTLIELLVVIAILGVLAVVLIVLINPADKVNSANDAGSISTAIQFGRAMDAYAASHNNFYVTGTVTVTDINTALGVLSTAGESKISSYTPVTGYVWNYLTSPTSPCTSGSTCTGYAIIITNLKSLKNTGGTPPAAGPIHQIVNGKSCYVATAITQAQLNTLAGSSGDGTGGSCP